MNTDEAYAAAVQYLFSNADFSGSARRYQNPHENWQRFVSLLELIGQPAKQLKIVHIAGTNGKGTTSALCDAMLRASNAGTVGLFTSPHLHSFRERIRINGGLASKESIVAALDVVRPAVESLGYASPFEKLTALALVCFVQNGCTWAVLETGLGGRWDCTNHSAPLVCGLTRIGYDHMNVLGDTISKIAGEKAGIMKKDIPAFTVPQEGDAMRVLTKTSWDVGVPLKLIEAEGFNDPAAKEAAELEDPLPMWLTPIHQQHNAAMAMAMMHSLSDNGHLEPSASLLKAWRHARDTVPWPCRFEVLKPAVLEDTNASLLLDVAHNEPAVGALLSSIDVKFPSSPFVLIFGANGDKDVKTIMKMLRVMPRLVMGIAVQSSHPKALPAQQVLESDGDEMTDVSDGDGSTAQWETANSMWEAVEKAAMALQGSAPGLVVCCGSVFVAADMRQALAANEPTLFREGDWVFEHAGEPALLMGKL